MRIRESAIILRLAAVGIAFALAPRHAPAQSCCGTRLTREDVDRALELIAAGAYDLPDAPRQTVYVPLRFHVVRTSQGEGGLPPDRICEALDDLDLSFLSVGMQFYLAGPIDYIDNDDFYYYIDTPQEIDALRRTNPVPGTVNVYFTPHLANQNGEFCGISSFTWSPVQGIVMHNDCTAVWWNHTTLSHEMGHYFDLFHTHETAFGWECVDGSNCAAAGDLLCDTPADPGLGTHNVSQGCQYTGAETDPCHADPYNPDTSNTMSSSRPHCRTSFTPQQIAKSLATLFNLRPELVHDGLPAPYDCNGNGVRDDCDIASGTSEDANSNGIPDECEAQPGDLNCDGVVDFGDINPFVLYLSSFPGWQAAYPDCPAENGDINQDGSYPSLGDINPFVALLAS